MVEPLQSLSRSVSPRRTFAFPCAPQFPALAPPEAPPSNCRTHHNDMASAAQVLLSHLIDQICRINRHRLCNFRTRSSLRTVFLYCLKNPEQALSATPSQCSRCLFCSTHNDPVIMLPPRLGLGTSIRRSSTLNTAPA